MTVPNAFPGRGIEYESTPPLIPLYKGVRGQAQKEKERYLQDLHVLLKRYLQDLHILLKIYFQDLHVLLKRYFQDPQKKAGHASLRDLPYCQKKCVIRNVSKVHLQNNLLYFVSVPKAYYQMLSDRNRF